MRLTVQHPAGLLRRQAGRQLAKLTACQRKELPWPPATSCNWSMPMAVAWKIASWSMVNRSRSRSSSRTVASRCRMAGYWIEIFASSSGATIVTGILTCLDSFGGWHRGTFHPERNFFEKTQCFGTLVAGKMSNSVKILKLVVSKDGKEPLVVKSCWETEGGVLIDSIPLTDKDYVRGKDRRRAFCLVLLLAKLPRRIKIARDAIISFEDQSQHKSWVKLIGTASREGELTGWVSKFFPKVNGQPLIRGHRATNKADASVDYNVEVSHAGHRAWVPQHRQHHSQ